MERKVTLLKARPTRTTATLLIALAIIGLSQSPFACAGEQQIQRLQEAVQNVEKRGKASEQADALYDLAKAYFENGNAQLGEETMRRALEKEQTLKRPDAGLRTRVALALILTAEKKYDEAALVYTEALAIAEKQVPAQAAGIVTSLGALSLVRNQLDDAQKFFEHARELAQKNDNPAGQAGALVNLAVIARSRKQSSHAIELLKEAVELVKVDDARTYGTALTELGRAQADAGQIDDAVATYQQAADVYKEEADNNGRAKVLLSMGQLYLSREQGDKALAPLVEAEQLAPNNLDVLIGVGAAHALASQAKEADAALTKAMRVATDANDGVRRRTILSEMGYAALLRGSPEKALTKFLDAYTMLQEQEPSNNRTKGVLLADIARSYAAVGQIAAAISYYEQSVGAFTKAGDQAGKAMATNGLAVCYLDSGKPALFESHYDQAKQLFASLNDKRSEAILDYNFAQYHMVQGHYADALPLYEAAQTKMQEAHDSKGESQVLRGLGLAYLYLGRAGKALEMYQQALPIAQATGNIEAQWDCELGMGKCYKSLQKKEQAVAHLEKAVDLVESERRQLSRDSFKTFNMDLRQDCFNELVDALIADNKIEESLEIAERGRARAFLDLLEGRKGRKVNEVIAAEPAAVPVKQSPPVPKPVSALPTKPAAVVHSTDRSVDVLPRAVNVVEASAISQENAAPPKLDEIKAIVARSGSTFIEYYVLPDKVVAWVIHPDGKVELAPPVVLKRQQLTDKIANTYKSIVGPPKSLSLEDVRNLNVLRQNNLKALHELLIAPVLPMVPKEPDAIVTIVPHGPLFSVPFAALMSSNGKFLAEDHTLSYAPAIGVLRATQKVNDETKNEPSSLLAFGNPITKAIAFLGTLPYAEKEVNHVAELFGTNRSTVRISGQATKRAFAQLAPKSTVLHLATHGLIDEEHPMQSAVVLAPEGRDDGLLTVKDILQLPSLKAKLVVLSACQTGRGKITGDGVIGLSRSFIIAGTPAVMVSQWNVDDVMTEYQMVAFYKEFLKNMGKARALRKAQLETIAILEKGSTTTGGTNTRANPRYWAAFQMIGEPN